jgi:hypothetical protein
MDSGPETEQFPGPGSQRAPAPREGWGQFLEALEQSRGTWRQEQETAWAHALEAVVTDLTRAEGRDRLLQTTPWHNLLEYLLAGSGLVPAPPDSFRVGDDILAERLHALHVAAVRRVLQLWHANGWLVP